LFDGINEFSFVKVYVVEVRNDCFALPLFNNLNLIKNKKRNFLTTLGLQETDTYKVVQNDKEKVSAKSCWCCGCIFSSFRFIGGSGNFS